MDVETTLGLLAKRMRYLETVETPETRVFSWCIPNPAVGVVGQMRITWDCTVELVDVNIIGGGTCTLNVEQREMPGAAGIDILAADVVADADGEIVTAGWRESALTAGHYLAVDVAATAGAPTWLSITVEGI